MNTAEKRQEGLELDWLVWLRQQRRRAVDILLAMVLVLGWIGLVASFWRSWTGYGFNSALPGYLITYVILLVLFFMRRLGDERRALGFLAVLYLFSLYAFYMGWLVGGGRTFLLAMVVAAVVLSSMRASYFAAIASVLTFIFFGAAFSLHWLRLRELPNPTDFSPIIIEGVGFFIAVGVVVISQWFFGQALQAATRSNQAAQESRAMLNERASELEAANRQIAHRAAALAAAAEVTRDTTSALNRQTLYDTVTPLVCERFAYDFCGIFILENGGSRAVLKAFHLAENRTSTLEVGYSLDTAGQGIVARTVNSRKAQVVEDVSREPAYLPCRDLPDTLSELSLPLRAHNRILGVLDIQSCRQDAFIQEDVNVLQLLADQVALAIDNLLLVEQLQQRTDQLEAANRELEAFSYSVSHDLRAPLRAITGYSALLEEECHTLSVEACQDYLQRIQSSADQMSQLIDGLLRLARLTYAELQIQPIDLSEISRQVAKALKRTQPLHMTEFQIADGLSTQGDPTMVRAVMQNLLENAWKFTRKQETALIQVGAMEVEGEQVFFVRDNGAGFDMAYVDKLFGAFQRLHRVEEYPGSGIGLATVKRILQRHGGRIWAEGAVGQGATFYFTLPAGR